MTLPCVITKNPLTGARNVGIYRMQKVDAKTAIIHWQVHKDAARDWRDSEQILEVAVAFGCDPVTTYMAGAPLPKYVDEFAAAGHLRGAPTELVRAKSIATEVPARAEIVLEGHVIPGDMAPEGPFGDHTGYYTPQEDFPVFHITTMTMRRDAIYPSIVVGPPPAEDAWMGKANERMFAPLLRLMLPEVVDYDLPVAGAFQHCAIVSLKKSYPGEARMVIHAIWGQGLLSLVKSVIVVDHFVNVHDYQQVFFHVCANVDPIRDFVLTHGPLDQLDHAAVHPCFGGKLGIDATHKLPAEGSPNWPDRILMTDDIRNLVDRRWETLGIQKGVG
jgi:4-hydroxy-3-polyprenylbenzoate decarboxylase